MKSFRSSRWAAGALGAVLAVFAAGPLQAQDGAPEGVPEGSGQIVMNVIEIKGKVERPQAVYIINLARPEMRSIKLERDFLENVKDEDFSGLNTFSVDANLAPETFADEPAPAAP